MSIPQLTDPVKNWKIQLAAFSAVVLALSMMLGLVQLVLLAL